MALLLTSCSQPIEIKPNKLPDAYLNDPYQAEIEIIGGSVVEMSFSAKVSDTNFRILHHIDTDGYPDYNHLTVQGTPIVLKPIYIKLVGGTYGTNFPGKEFVKEYKIMVKEQYNK